MNGTFGFVIINKPRGLTSHDCVHRIRKVFGLKRVGHGGTLDPSVTGILPIALGNATRLLPYLPKSKSYRGTVKLGLVTTTDDMDGEIITEKVCPQLTNIALENFLDCFRGTITQKPPQYSSVHYLGERAYKRARRGEYMDLPAKTITVYKLRLLEWDQSRGELEIEIHCSSGTYIRAIARDLGNKIGSGGCLLKLHRTQAMGFKEEHASFLPDTQTSNPKPPLEILSPLTALSHLPQLKLATKKELNDWQTGRQIVTSMERIKSPMECPHLEDESSEPSVVIIDCDGVIAGIAQRKSPTILQPKIVFNAKG